MSLGGDGWGFYYWVWWVCFTFHQGVVNKQWTPMDWIRHRCQEITHFSFCSVISSYFKQFWILMTQIWCFCKILYLIDTLKEKMQSDCKMFYKSDIIWPITRCLVICFCFDWVDHCIYHSLGLFCLLVKFCFVWGNAPCRCSCVFFNLCLHLKTSFIYRD